MAEWRLGRGWNEVELLERLNALRDAPRNLEASVSEIEGNPRWHHDHSEAAIGEEDPGPPVPGGPFERGALAVSNYQFSDPHIVIAHFDRASNLMGRRILLELRALRILHYLGGVVVGAVRSESGDRASVFGFRYETLAGHIERGAEWFLLRKDHVTGVIRFRIEAAWLPGQLPNWWSRIGFSMLGRRYQERWHRRAHAAMAALIRDPGLPVDWTPGDVMMHSAPEVIFKRTEARDAG